MALKYCMQQSLSQGFQFVNARFEVEKHIATNSGVKGYYLAQYLKSPAFASQTIIVNSFIRNIIH